LRTEVHESGEHVGGLGAGSLFCVGCGFAFSIAALDALPECPNCGASRFRRASLFDQPTVDTDALEAPEEAPDWVPAARELIEEPGCYLAYEGTDGEPEVIEIEEGWTRIGRSAAADLCLDDATVSRRHALVVLTESGELRALDDRSLNGLFVNGEQVEWAPLSDGDELEIGRYRLYVLEA
jgi:predicted  nucleic acid-binding Zn-ribbon protein